jgi:DNA-binding response OmpR family regulator
MTQSQRILVLSDEVPSTIARGALEERGFKVIAAEDSDTAFRKLLESPFDLVVVDLVKPEEGVEFVGRVRDTAKLRQTFVLTVAEWGTGQATMALARGADSIEPRPVDATRLVLAVERLLRKQMTRAAVQ